LESTGTQAVDRGVLSELDGRAELLGYVIINANDAITVFTSAMTAGRAIS
jgi:hypothetical protein